MSISLLKQSFRCCSGPVLFLAGICTCLGVLFLSLHSGSGWVFLIAAASALTVFVLRGASRGSALSPRAHT